MADFQIAFAQTSVHEGGYANNVRDRGGETFRGISRINWPGWKGWPEIDAAKESGKNLNAIKNKKLDGLVADFYLDFFWRPLKCGDLENQLVAGEVFDTAVNMGPKVAAKFLQESANILGQSLELDGVIGPKTIAAVNACDPDDLLRLLNLMQGARYLEIVRRDPGQRVFIRGWLRRTDVPVITER